jgi:hypothetical protein
MLLLQQFPPMEDLTAALADPAAVRALPGQLILSVSHRKLVLYGVFVWVRRANSNSRKRRFPARAAARDADARGLPRGESGRGRRGSSEPPGPLPGRFERLPSSMLSAFLTS